MTWLSYMPFRAKLSLRCDVVVTNVALVCASMDIFLCDMGSTYSYVSVQWPWNFIWFVIQLMPSSMIIPS